jgi:hypothetical protein
LKYFELRKFRKAKKKFVQALVIRNGDKNKQGLCVARPAQPGSKQLTLHYPNTCVENSELDFPQSTCLLLGPHCQGILFKDCKILGVLSKLCSLDLVK